jgi:hypothetical protein
MDAMLKGIAALWTRERAHTLCSLKKKTTAREFARAALCRCEIACHLKPSQHHPHRVQMTFICSPILC